jgi:transposase
MSKKRYPKEFKAQAIELAKELGNTSEAARQLGITDSLLHSWKRQYGGATGSGLNAAEAIDQAEENRRLRKEVEELKKINTILQRAAAFFSQD